MAVLVVTVASQARNTKQQQTEDEALLSPFGVDQRHPRFISRTITNHNNTSETPSDAPNILKSLRALVMRVVTPTLNQTTVSNASGPVFADSQPSYAGESKVIVRRK